MDYLSFRISAALGVAALLASSTPASAFHDGGLDPGIGQPLIMMLNMAGQQCQMGNQQGCATVQQIQQAGAMLVQAQAACQQGDQQACQMYQMGGQQVMGLYQQVQAAQGQTMPGQPPQMAPQGGYDPNQMQSDHEQRMQNMQNQFGQQNQQWQQNQILNDQRHQQFMETLR